MKLDMQKSVYWYKIHPGRSTNYFQVYVWPTHKRFIKALHVSRDTVGIFIAPPRSARKKTRCVGDVHLCKMYLHPDVIIHEWTHAALSWAKRQDRMDFGTRNTRWGKMSTPDEEAVCNDASRLSEVCMKQLESRGYKITPSKAIRKMYGD